MIRGVDVSAYNPHVNWPQLVVSGLGGFAYAKCTEQAGVDAMHTLHVLNARAAGVPIGSYCFGHPSHAAPESVDTFLAHAFLGELRPVIDMEALAAGNVVPHNAAEWADRWCEMVKAATGTEPIIYASTSYWQTLCTLKPEIGGPIGWNWWAAQYGGKRPHGSIAWQEQGDVKLAGQDGLWDIDSIDADNCDVLRV